MTLQECKDSIGKKVTYVPYKGCDQKLLEYGVIKSVNDMYVFVAYGGDLQSKATRPEDIRLNY